MSKISADHLSRRACVYIRQSTPDQVRNNLESQRRQYALAERARTLGWHDVEVIDDDLGSSGSGSHRPGFERLLGALCEGTVGAVFSVEASRLARNGRDWHTLLEFCSVVGALLVDADGVYDPRDMEDRLLLGMLGTLSEMELASFRQRAQAALRQKAERGELHHRVAVGYVRGEGGRLEKSPDARVRAVIDLVFRKFAELASVRQVYFWFEEQRIELPAVGAAGDPAAVAWKPPRYHALLSLLKNPVYAGAYVYGRTKAVARLEAGRRRVARVRREAKDWDVLIADHHDGYIGWEEYQSNQALIANNANCKGAMVQGSIKRGAALLSGLLRCGHCGAKLVAQYPGPTVVRYQCGHHILHREASCCISFGGLRADRLVAEQVLLAIAPLGIRAALQAMESLRGDDDERLRQKELALEQARYEAGRAQRQYDAVDSANRLVAAELERRWNAALAAQRGLEEEVERLRREQPGPLSAGTRRELLAMAEDLPRLWSHPGSLPEFRKRVLRAVLVEIVARREGEAVHLVLHWQGGDHTELKFRKARTGQHRHVTAPDTIDLIRSLAATQPDPMIASVLNRLGRRTAHDRTWNARRVCSIRNHHGIPVFREGERQARGELTVKEAAALLGVSSTKVLRMIRSGQLPGSQACANAPWILRRRDVDAVLEASASTGCPETANPNQLALEIQ
ncbi:MAG: recombinase family protein [Gammaproteobacteria bacterium]|nr:recombinase family protein [Gammaproteobacteria bacterium]